MSNLPPPTKINDMNLAVAATRGARLLLDDIDWDSLIGMCHEALSLIADGKHPPGVALADAEATVRANLVAVNATRTYLRALDEAKRMLPIDLTDVPGAPIDR